MGASSRSGFGMTLVAVMLAAAGCGSMGVDPTTEGYKALEAGDYAKARDFFWEMYTRHPDDPFVELNLAASYQGLGRIDLAEPFYRQVLENGRNVAAPVTRNTDKSDKTLAEIACTNLRRDLHNLANC
jgi:Flp pilus assembly protein TadD